MEKTFSILDTIEKYITIDIPKFDENISYEELRTNIITDAQKYRKFSYVYFVNNEHELVGVISIKDFLELQDDQSWKEKIVRNVKYAFPDDTIEKTVLKALHSKIMALPIIDKDKKLIGVLSSDDLLQLESEIIQTRTYRHSGIFHHNKLYELAESGSILKLVLARLPWLILGSLGGFLMARFVGIFEHNLEKNIILAFFIPVIVYMSDAVGTQTEALFIRSIALNEKADLVKYIFKDFIISTFLGFIIGAFLFSLVFWWRQDLSVAFVIGFSMYVNISLSSPIAIIIPSIFRKFKKDPAIGSGPLATIIQDSISLAIYFAIAQIVIGI